MGRRPAHDLAILSVSRSLTRLSSWCQPRGQGLIGLTAHLEKALLPTYSHDGWQYSIPCALLDCGPTFLAGCGSETTLCSLSWGPLQHGSLLYQSVQAKKAIASASKKEVTVLYPNHRSAIPHVCCVLSNRNELLGPLQTSTSGEGIIQGHDGDYWRPASRSA